jgi:hypothetical protein
MTQQQAGPGVRVRVTANSVKAMRYESDTYLKVGDIITLTGQYEDRPWGMGLYYDRGPGYRKHYVRITEIELESRVRYLPKVDVWEAARGYIR